MKSNKTYNTMRSDLETSNQDLIRKVNELQGHISFLDETIAKYRKQSTELQKIKKQIEELLMLLIDNKVIKGWYYNGEYHWEINENEQLKQSR